MNHRWLVLLFLLPAAAVAAEQSMTVTINDTPPVDRIVIDELSPANRKETKFKGTATLFLDDGSSVPLMATRWWKKRKLIWKYKLKTAKGVTPKFRCGLKVSEDFSEVQKLKVELKLDTGKVKQKDPTKALVAPSKALVPEDLLAIHDQDLTVARPSCQATGCHENQMEQYAPHKDAAGNDVETFHHLKARTLSAIFFGGRSPEALTDQDCTVCHKRVKLLLHSGADASGANLHLRRMVDTSLCAGCHGPSSSKPLYLK